MKKGFFITFEGPDGSGKTTITKNVVDKLIEMGYDVCLTREPGGIGIAEQIRNVILDPKNTSMDARTEALLYAASRRQHLVEKVMPALEAGKLVICDRFLDSSLAYQGNARGLGIDNILGINEFAIDGLYPDLTVYLDISAEGGIERVNSRREAKDRLDSESIEFHKKVVEGYKKVNERFKDRIKVVDATNSIDEVTKDSLDAILNYIND